MRIYTWSTASSERRASVLMFATRAWTLRTSFLRSTLRVVRSKLCACKRDYFVDFDVTWFVEAGHYQEGAERHAQEVEQADSLTSMLRSSLAAVACQHAVCRAMYWESSGRNLTFDCGLYAKCESAIRVARRWKMVGCQRALPMYCARRLCAVEGLKWCAARSVFCLCVRLPGAPILHGFAI